MKIIQTGMGHRMVHNFLSAGLILTWIVTPEALVLVSKVSGLSNGFHMFAFGTGLLLSLLAVSVIHGRGVHEQGDVSENNHFDAVLGKRGALAVITVGRVPIVLFASTGMLVSAGFAFNEVFLYWFPNFLFASMLLTFIAGLHLMGRGAAVRAQMFFVVIAVSGLTAILCLAAFKEPALVQETSRHREFAAFPQAAAIAFLVFLGFDFFHSSRGSSVVYVTLAMAFTLVVLWSEISLRHISAEQLSDSAISYMLLARKAAGDIGRYIMGAAVISGVAAGVNGLFLACRNSFAYLYEQKDRQYRKRAQWLLILSLAVIIETMMMTGFAGEEILESQVRASLALWLLYLGARIVVVGAAVGHTSTVGKTGAMIIGLSIWAIMAYLIIIDTNMWYIAGFMAVAIAISSLVSLLWWKLNFCPSAAKDNI